MGPVETVLVLLHLLISGTIGLIGLFSNIWVSTPVNKALVCVPSQSITRQGRRAPRPPGSLSLVSTRGSNLCVICVTCGSICESRGNFLYFDQEGWKGAVSSGSRGILRVPWNPRVTPLLRWRASNVTQPCNNWRHGFRFTALECPSRSCRGHPWCHAT